MSILEKLVGSVEKHGGNCHQMKPSSSTMSEKLLQDGSSSDENKISKISRIAAIVMFALAIFNFVMGRLSVLSYEAVAAGKDFPLQGLFQFDYRFIVSMAAAVFGIVFCMAVLKAKPLLRTPSMLGLMAWVCFLLWGLVETFFWRSIGIGMRVVIYDGYLLLAVAFLVSLFVKMRHARGSWFICIVVAMLVFDFVSKNLMFELSFYSRLVYFFVMSGFYLVMSRIFHDEYEE